MRKKEKRETVGEIPSPGELWCGACVRAHDRRPLRVETYYFEEDHAQGQAMMVGLVGCRKHVKRIEELLEAGVLEREGWTEMARDRDGMIKGEAGRGVFSSEEGTHPGVIFRVPPEYQGRRRGK